MTASTTRRLRTSERLASIRSISEMDALLREISSGRASFRWTRTQCLHYLPIEFHAAAEGYFDGERFRAAQEFPAPPQPIDVPKVEEALRTVNAMAAPEQAPDGRDDSGLRSVEEILARDAALSQAPPIGAMLAAMRAEMRTVNMTAPKRYRLRNGTCIGSGDGWFTYRFQWSSEPDIHVPGVLHVGTASVSARVGDQAPDGEKSFDLTVEQYLGPDIIGAVFRIDPTFLLRSAYERLRIHNEQSDELELIVKALTTKPQPLASSPAIHELKWLNREQQRAVATAAVSKVAYVWGPPGTGKTRSVGALVSALVGQGKRVLILSPYNVAVDEAVVAVANNGSVPQQALVRFGRIGAEVRRMGLDLDSHLERSAEATGLLDAARRLWAATITPEEQTATPPSTVRACLDQLGAVIVRMRQSERDPQVRAIGNAIAKLRALFRAPEAAIIKDASVVGCTLALSSVSKLVYERGYDHLIIDEASVVRTPEAMLAVLNTGWPVTFFGDPMQLPAIVQEQGELAERWLARSPFALAGISGPTDATGPCVMLEEQHRMAPAIRTIVSDLFYAGRLRDGAGAPSEGTVMLVDTSDTPARATTRMVRLSHSRENVIHRQVVAEVVRAVLRREPDSQVLVLSPFVAQKRAYRREPNTSRLTRDIRFETIHTSQGSERDVVVLDLVLAPSRGGGGSRMLDDRRNAHLANLLNVAISRARKRLILVGHRATLERLYGDGLVGKLLKKALQAGNVVVVPSDLRCREAFTAI